ncbi:glycerophosphodiester phosphodiesterase [Ruegeria sp. PrR005]|uniref:Glycerophosphodiester phosphodiesterase n=1 Tax=Ruegeria sp. PrR005 TaxID=2706882 RepID=A0A6B2NMF2_9RHOB|nr:glycerophosphodiester phosphodiesterase [Ruegeria sp. PrR005]NDW45256.1 glycerophosphodiester phosphodiesterase [Ruegeria sp. PrR005]
MSHLSNVASAWRQSWSRRGLFVPLYAALRLLALALIAPSLAGLVNLAVALSNQSALTDQDIARFILSPLGFAATLAVLSILLVAEVLSFSVMAASLRSPESDVWRTGSAAFALVLRRLRALLSFAVLFILRLLLLIAPFAALAGLVAWWKLTDYDINYYLTFHPPEFWVAVVLIGLIVLLLAGALILRLSGWALALHLVLFEGMRPREVFAESTRRMGARRTGLKIELVIWVAIRIAIAAGIAAVANLAMAVIPIPAEGGLRRALILIVLVLGLWALAVLVLSAIGLGALAKVLDGFYGGTATVPSPSARVGLRGRLFGAAGIAAVALGIGAWVSDGLLTQLSAEDDVAVIGHRGAAGARPENTMASIVKAIEDGADWVEIDVQETADGEIVVMHDSDFMKLAGVPTKIWDATMQDLEAIDIGGWYAPEYSVERTPTLRAVLEAARDKSRVLIELKYYGHDVDLENRVIALVEELGMQDQIATMSLKYPAVQKMRALRPKWRTGVLAATAVGDLAGLEGDFIAVSTASLRPSLVRAVHAAGKEIYVWTVNEPLLMSKMISLGVDGLITDEPAMAREVLEVRATLNPAERVLLWLTQEMGWEADAKEYRDESP